tara:strand:+ start:430 stop:564 length:135 start_codon:yes stop_codon:yes gene_type:complete
MVVAVIHKMVDLVDQVAVLLVDFLDQVAVHHRMVMMVGVLMDRL